jgi:phage shock protein PspC (stress-responsive transcriptional regulator)
MPILANRYVDPTTDEATRAAITVIYDMLNSFAGGLGEVIGVGFFAALWAALVAYVILRDGTMPRWLGVFGLVVAVLLTAGLGEIFGIDVGILLTLNVVLLHFWWWAMAAVLLLRPRLVHA